MAWWLGFNFLLKGVVLDFKTDIHSSADTATLQNTFKGYSGPVLRLTEDVTFQALNEAAEGLAARLNGDAGVTVLPSVVQLAVKVRTEGRSRTRTFTLPDTDRQIEFLMLPQADGTQLMLGRDTTLETNIRNALVESRTRHRDLLDLAVDFTWETDLEGRISFISPNGALGYSPEELLGQEASSFLLNPEVALKPLPFMADRTVREVDVWMATRAGDPVCLSLSATPILNQAGAREGVRGIARDVSNERQIRTELARTKLRERLIWHVTDAVATETTPIDMLHAAARALMNATTVDGGVIQVDGPAHGAPLAHIDAGNAPDLAVTLDVLETRGKLGPGLYDGQSGKWQYLCGVTEFRGVQNGSILLWRSEGQSGWNEDEPFVLKAVMPHLGVVFRQIGDQHTLESLVRTDPVTGLFNRKAFVEDLDREIVRSQRYGNHCALLFVKVFLPRPEQADELDELILKRVSAIFTSGIRQYDRVGRIAADSFAVWLDNADITVAQMRAKTFIKNFENWKEEIQGGRAITAAQGAEFAVGIALFKPDDSCSISDLMEQANSAMENAALLNESDPLMRIVLCGS